MEQEQFLREQFGTKRDFKVPEHYFDTLNERIMSRVAEESSQKIQPSSRYAVIRKLRPMMVAAVMIGVIFVAMLFIKYNYSSSGASSSGAAPVEVQTSEGDVARMETQNSQLFEESTDYMMLDKDDMYTYMNE